MLNMLSFTLSMHDKARLDVIRFHFLEAFNSASYDLIMKGKLKCGTSINISESLTWYYHVSDSLIFMEVPHFNFPFNTV